VNRESSSGVVPPFSALAPGVASAEWKLLLAASAGESPESDLVCGGLLEAEVRNSPDWEEVIRLADHHGTASLLYQNLGRLGDGVPSAVRESLRHRYEKNVRKTLFLARELMRILDCLNAQGIEAIPYKGITLSEVYYGDMALRQAGDIDLFIRREDVTRSKSAVRGLGYTPRITIPEEAEEDYIDAGYEWTFDSPAGNSLLELQWALEPRFYAVDFDLDGLFGRAANTTVAGRAVQTLSSEDLLLVLAVHAAKHVWGRLIWLCDIARIVKRGNLNWDWVQEQAREAGIERILHITLLLAKQLLGMGIPAAIDSSIPEDRTVPTYADEVAMNMARGILYDVEKISYFRLMMQLRERRADRMRFLTRLTLTPGPGEWEVVRLPKILFPLYRVVRMARLAARLVG
jgi:hypothetical protein